MNRQEVFVVDSFVSDIYSGNPAGVCVLEDWPADEVMLRIAAINGFSETAFVVPRNGSYGLRWFTPKVEVPLCGHATLAAAFVLAEQLDRPEKTFVFDSLSGELRVSRLGDIYYLDFPTRELIPAEQEFDLLPSLVVQPLSITRAARSIIAELDSQEQVAALKPDFDEIAKFDMNGVVITARGKEVDFVSRFFAPRVGIPEDPVTGAVHTGLIPFWSHKLHKTTLLAHQISERGGELFCEMLGERVRIGGRGRFQGVRVVSTDQDAFQASP